MARRNEKKNANTKANKVSVRDTANNKTKNTAVSAVKTTVEAAQDAAIALAKRAAELSSAFSLLVSEKAPEAVANLHRSLPALSLAGKDKAGKKRPLAAAHRGPKTALGELWLVSCGDASTTGYTLKDGKARHVITATNYGCKTIAANLTGEIIAREENGLKRHVPLRVRRKKGEKVTVWEPAPVDRP